MMSIRRLGLAARRRAAGFSQEALAVRLRVERTTVARWEAGATDPQPWVRPRLADVLGVSLSDIAQLLAPTSGRSATSAASEWDVDSLASLADLGSSFVDLTRRTLLKGAAYSVAASGVPEASWWRRMAYRLAARPVAAVHAGRADLEATREATMFFSRLDQRHGGGQARSAVVQYLTADVAPLLRARYADESVRRAMFSTAGELSYLAGWMAFDNAEHATAQRFFTTSVKFAAEADDPSMAAHTLRAMAHQAVALGHAGGALAQAEASVERARHGGASPRERALVGVVHARALAAMGDKRETAVALHRAEAHLASAASGDEEPSRVFFFGEASLAHETGCALRDIGDLATAERQLHHSVRTREAGVFTRTHAVTLGYLGAVQARRGDLDEASRTWTTTLDVIDGVHSARARQTVVEMRAVLAIHTATNPRLAELDRRAAHHLALTRQGA